MEARERRLVLKPIPRKPSECLSTLEALLPEHVRDVLRVCPGVIPTCIWRPYVERRTLVDRPEAIRGFGVEDQVLLVVGGVKLCVRSRQPFSAYIEPGLLA